MKSNAVPKIVQRNVYVRRPPLWSSGQTSWLQTQRSRLFVGKPEGKRPPGRPRCRCIDNIKMDLLEIELSVMDWIGLALDWSGSG
jgi:hypothetical protein